MKKIKEVKGKPSKKGYCKQCGRSISVEYGRGYCQGCYNRKYN